MASRNRDKREAEAAVAEYKRQARAYRQAVQGYQAARASLIDEQRRINAEQQRKIVLASRLGPALRRGGARLGGARQLVGFAR